ncbi:TrbG/VirB9 family P-type conjugative transfer protein [Hydrogenophaga pseudoflava]|uniref:TrbG/VirB9 family P-type conjugative transfer protein n=1 Tax=Hydrogenophaga pseudoflava TaxID=47421 RepID=UPI0027E4CB3E|nr:TrbG/VirB9 family P-type conjugative transfer protein [Hydrogenophaga pseudoflava]MDQ7744589.1 TrbG/VirB9 family P-type conjugative transfer protein [Hydrogenophaga pseudoflava]
MNLLVLPLVLLPLTLAPLQASAAQPGDKADPRLREVVYDANAVVTVPVKRGMVTLVEFDPGEVINEVAVGQGGDCSKADAAWCVAAQQGGRHLYVKAKSAADAPNNLAVVTDRRSHALHFVVLPDGDRQSPVYRLAIRSLKPSTPALSSGQKELAALANLPPIPPPPTAQQIVAERLAAKPTVLNTQYALAEGAGSADIVPTLVYDDGRFTFLRFPGNREVPAVFHVLGDGSETLVNARMEHDTLVVDRVSRRLMLRAGSAVVGIWNEAFDLEGSPAQGSTTVPGVQRVLKSNAAVLSPSTPGAKP